MRRIALLAWIVAVGLPPVVSGQIPPGYYEFRVTDNPIKEQNPRMNSRQIVFEARMDGTVEGTELFLYDAETEELQRLTNDNVRDAFPDISEGGTITWSRFIGPAGEFGPTAEIMMRRPDGTELQITSNAEDDYEPRINGSEHLAWYRSVGPGCGGAVADIYFFDGQTTIPITTNAIPEDLINQAVSLNDSDEITWTEYDFCLSPWESRVMMYSGGATTEISSPWMFEPQGASLNNNHQVVFNWYDWPADEHRLVLWEGGETTFLTIGRGALLNDRGDLGMTRWHDDVSAWQPWLHRDGQDWRLTDDEVWNIHYDLNNLGESVWFADALGVSDIVYLRRFELGDVNCDGAIDAFDIQPFLVALFDPQGYPSAYPNCDPLLADINDDGFVNAFDIQAFIELLFP